MTPSTSRSPVSRRTALAGISGGGLGLVALATSHASAQDASVDIATHPIVGAWLAGRAPNDIGVTLWSADGTMTNNTGPAIGTGADGALVYSDPTIGSWVPVSDRGIHFIFTHRMYDPAGKLVGYGTVEGYPVVSDDGASFWDDGTQVTVTIRDANAAVLQVMGPGMTDAGIGGVRLIPGKSGYDEMLAMLASRTPASPEAGTPTS
jgi:hypothetical protein